MKNSGLRYQWLKGRLEEDILNDYKPSDKFLSQREIMAKYKASFSTVDRALRELVEDGILKRYHGKGTFVCEQKPGAGSGGKKLALIMSRNVSFAPTHFYAEILMTITAEMGNDGYSFVFIYLDEDDPVAPLVVRLTGKEDFIGAFLIGNVSERLIDTLADQRFPFVLVDRGTDRSGIPFVKTDNVDGAEKAVTYLIRSGHRRIGFVSTQLHTSFLERYEGYCMGMAANGIKLDKQLVLTRFRLDSNGDDLDAILHMEAPPTAIFAANDAMCFYIIQILRGKGIRVPDDISVMGFDGDTISHTLPVMTTMALDRKAMGLEAVAIIRDLMLHGKAESVIMTTELQNGDTVRPIV